MFTIDAGGDGAEHKRQQEVKTAQGQRRRLFGLGEAPQEARVGDDGERKQLRRQVLWACDSG